MKRTRELQLMAHIKGAEWAFNRRAEPELNSIWGVRKPFVQRTLIMSGPSPDTPVCGSLATRQWKATNVSLIVSVQCRCDSIKCRLAQTRPAQPSPDQLKHCSRRAVTTLSAVGQPHLQIKLREDRNECGRAGKQLAKWSHKDGFRSLMLHECWW